MLIFYQVSLPERILQKKLKALIIQIQIEKELYYQQQRAIELQTDLLTIPLEYGGKKPYLYLPPFPYLSAVTMMLSFLHS